MASVRPAGRMFCAAAQTAAAPASSSRWDRSRSSRAGVWCRSSSSDYKEACREMVVGAWERPSKTSSYAASSGGAWACFHTRPDQASFEAASSERSNQSGLSSPWIRNGVSDGHVQSSVRLRNEGRSRYASSGSLCVVYGADYDPDTMSYEARCANSSRPWRELPQRSSDVGFAGCWWVSDSKMKDYDVNQDEYKHLPAHMQETAPPSPQEVEKNERLHRDSWLPSTTEDKEAETKAEDKTEPISEQSQTEVMENQGGA